MRKFRIVLLAFILLLSQVGTVFAASSYYVVKEGDNLWTIASKKGVSVEALKKANHLTSDCLQIGDKLVISSSTPSRAQTPQASVSSNGIYTVQEGDSLWSIARKFDTNVAAIKSLNNLSSERLDIGDKLYVKGTPRPAAAVTPSRAGTVAAVNPAPQNEAAAPVATGSVCQLAAQYLGTPYRYGGASPGGFDCSGFVGYVFKQCGYSLPRTAVAISGVGTAVDKGSLKEGDLVFFQGPGASCINHVGIYVGGGQFIHSSSGRSYGVTYSYLSGPYYSDYYSCARRVLPE